jgi:hypothetical protein
MRLLLLLLLIFLAKLAFGQNMRVSAGMEQTVAGSESILATGFQSKKKWSYGAFLQTRLTPSIVEGASDLKSRSWYGFYINAPLARTEKINVYFQLRSGLKEERFVVLVPSVETEIRITHHLHVSVAGSFRHQYPALSIKTHLLLFNRSK